MKHAPAQRRKLEYQRDSLPQGAAALEIDAIDHIEIYCENARQAAYYFAKAYGFKPAAYRGLETGDRSSSSYALKQGKITLVVTSPLAPDFEITRIIFRHGTSVKDVALRVPSCEAFFEEAVRRGAVPVSPPQAWESEEGIVKRASIKLYGHVVHSIVERKEYKGIYWPGYVPYEQIFHTPLTANDCGLRMIDHVVGNVELGKMNEWVAFYETVLGFKQMTHFTDKQISTEYSALMSKVMSDGKARIKFPINEPAEGKRKSQIAEYLEFHHGPGVQHIALLSEDIIETVAKLREQGVSFLRVPKTYYDEVPARVGSIREDLQRIAELGILVDRDDEGYLLQIFTKPIHDRPTLFFEIIQRKGARGFGEGNFKALFEALERDQEERGNL